MGLCCSKHKDPQTSAVAKSPSLPGIVGDLPINRSLARQDDMQRLIKRFRESSSPESMRSAVFSPDEILCEYTSASYHLPGAYVGFFPCLHCTYKDEEERTSFVEVFHVANVHKPDVFATVTFVMPADAFLVYKPTECSVEVEFTQGCPNAPIAVHHSPLFVLHIDTYVLIEALRFLPRSELEKMLLVSRRWSDIIGGAEGSLPQRRRFHMDMKFYGERPGMLSVHFSRGVRLGEDRILRVLTTRGVSQALNAVRSHLRNAFVQSVTPAFQDHVPLPGTPRDMLVNISLDGRIDWLKSLLRSMPPNSEVGSWRVSDTAIGSENLHALANCALEAHRTLGCVQALRLDLFNDDATWVQVAGLLGRATIRAFSEITVSTKTVAISTSKLRAILLSWQSMKLHVYVTSVTTPRDSLLTLPQRIIQDFLALHDASSFVAECSLRINVSDKITFEEMPNVDEATGRQKRFRFHLQGEDTVVRVSVYENPTTREHLTVVTFDRFRLTVRFFKGNLSLAALKQILQRPYHFYGLST